MKNPPYHKQILQTVTAGRAAAGEFRDMADRLDDGQKAILRRLVKQAHLQKPDGHGHYEFWIATDRLDRERPGEDMGARLQDAMERYDQARETEATYRRLVRQLADIGALEAENYERPRFTERREIDGTSTYLRLSGEEIARLGRIVGVKTPGAVVPDRN